MTYARLSRRTFVAGCTLLTTALALPALRAQPKLERPRISLAVGGKSAFYYLPLTISEQLGYFRAEGLNLEILDFPAGASALQAVLGGSAQICSGAYEHTINLQAKKQMFQAFVLQGRTPQIAVGVSTRAMPRYRTVADLRGKRIGISAPGSSTNMIANLVLSRGGLKPGDVSFVAVGSSDGAIAALRSGQIDAMSNTDPVMTMLEQRGEVKIISDTRTLKGTLDVFGGPMPAACLFASAGFVQENPDTCQALANAIVRGLKWLQTAGPGDILKAVPESYLLGDRGLYLASFNKMRESISPDGILPDEGARTAVKALASFDPAISEGRIDTTKTYTNAFAERAKERFNA